MSFMPIDAQNIFYYTVSVAAILFIVLTLIIFFAIWQTLKAIRMFLVDIRLMINNLQNIKDNISLGLLSRFLNIFNFFNRRR